MEFVIVLAYCLLLLTFATCYNPYLDKTTPHLKEIFLGRCNMYQELSLANLNPSLKVSLECQDALDVFLSIFKSKDPCKSSLNEGDYQKLFNIIYNNKKLVNKSMFWSGTREVVHNFTYINNDYYTLEDTFSGYLANDLNWCGCETCPDGIGWSFCNKSCPSQTTPFWSLASRNFAKSASGIAYVMVNGTPKAGNTAYYRGSTFGKVELPTLGKEKNVDEIHVYVVTDIDQHPKAKCGEASLAQLEEDVTHYGMKMKCIEDPKMVTDLLCAKYPHAKQCKERKSGQDTNNTWKYISLTFIIISIVLLLIIMAILIAATRKLQAVKGSVYKHMNENV